MIRSILVLTMLVVASGAYASEQEMYALCTGMATALNLPDKPMFEAFIDYEVQRLKVKYKKNSDKHVEIAVNNARNIGYGEGQMNGLSHSRGKDELINIFIDYCYKGDRAFRNKILTENGLH